MPLTNPHANESSFVQDQPANLPVLPFEKPTSEIGQEAARLHRAAQAATARLREIRDAQINAAGRLTQARAALEAEIVRGAREGLNQEREHHLSLELSAAERLADPSTHQLRHRAAVQAQRAAVREVNVYLWDHLPELLDAELRDEAEAASAELVAALESIRPPSERYQAVQRNVYELVRVAAAGEHGQHFATNLKLAAEPAPPLPSEEALEEFDRAKRPVELAVLDAD